MYKWRIVVYLNTGDKLVGAYNGDEDNSEDVAERLFLATSSAYTGILNQSENGNLVIKKDAIIAMDIIPWKINKDKLERDENGRIKLDLKERLGLTSES